MDELQALSKGHPFSSTVYFMMGQVEENFGKNKEAVACSPNRELKTPSIRYRFSSWRKTNG